MKILKIKNVSKMVARFDNELKNILMNDIKLMRTANLELLSRIKQRMEPGTLSVA